MSGRARIAASCFPTASASGEATSYADSGLGKVVAHKNVRKTWRAPKNSARGQKDRNRCYMFKRKEQSKRVLGMIDAEGRKYEIEQVGHLNTITHNTVLKLVEPRSLRLCKQGELDVDATHNWSVDETGTIEVNTICLQEIEQQERLDMIGFSNDVLQVHGIMPGRKQEGVTKLLDENFNSLPN